MFWEFVLDKHFDRRCSWHELSTICSAWTESLDHCVGQRFPAPGYVFSTHTTIAA